MHLIVDSLDLGTHQLSHAAVAVVAAVSVVVLEHGGHAAQSAQVHFVAHGLGLRAHQISHAAVPLVVVVVVVGVLVETVPAMAAENAGHNDAVQC